MLAIDEVALFEPECYLVRLADKVVDRDETGAYTGVESCGSGAFYAVAECKSAIPCVC